MAISERLLFVYILESFLVVTLADPTARRLSGSKIMNILKIHTLACFAVHVFMYPFLRDATLTRDGGL